jgi:hypothetical protein
LEIKVHIVHRLSVDKSYRVTFCFERRSFGMFGLVSYTIKSLYCLKSPGMRLS